MVRENSVVALGAHDDKPDYHYGDGAELRLYCLKDEKEASCVVYDMDGSEKIVMTAKRDGNQLQIKTVSEQAYSIRLVNVIAISVSMGEVKIDKKDTVIQLKGNADISVTF